MLINYDYTNTIRRNIIKLDIQKHDEITTHYIRVSEIRYMLAALNRTRKHISITYGSGEEDGLFIPLGDDEKYNNDFLQWLTKTIERTT